MVSDQELHGVSLTQPDAKGMIVTYCTPNERELPDLVIIRQRPCLSCENLLLGMVVFFIDNSQQLSFFETRLATIS